MFVCIRNLTIKNRSIPLLHWLVCLLFIYSHYIYFVPICSRRKWLKNFKYTPKNKKIKKISISIWIYETHHTNVCEGSCVKWRINAEINDVSYAESLFVEFISSIFYVSHFGLNISVSYFNFSFYFY